jgi:hypothetical protein
MQALRDVLDAYFGSNDYAFDAWGYSTELDLAYQSTVTALASFADHVPCFDGMRQRAPIFEALPPALGLLERDDRHAWREHWRQETMALQSEMVAILLAAGIPRPTVARVEPTEPMHELGTEDEPSAPRVLAARLDQLTRPEKPAVTRATRRKESRQQHAWVLRQQGLTHKEIATELKCSVRAVQNYLADSGSE